METSIDEIVPFLLIIVRPSNTPQYEVLPVRPSVCLSVCLFVRPSVWAANSNTKKTKELAWTFPSVGVTGVPTFSLGLWLRSCKQTATQYVVDIFSSSMYCMVAQFVCIWQGCWELLRRVSMFEHRSARGGQAAVWLWSSTSPTQTMKSPYHRPSTGLSSSRPSRPVPWLPWPIFDCPLFLQPCYPPPCVSSEVFSSFSIPWNSHLFCKSFSP